MSGFESPDDADVRADGTLFGRFRLEPPKMQVHGTQPEPDWVLDPDGSHDAFQFGGTIWMVPR